MECFCKSNPLSAPASSASFDCVAKHESLVPLVDGVMSRHFSTRSQLHMGHVKFHLLLVQPDWMMSNCFFICSHDSHDINFFIFLWCFETCHCLIFPPGFEGLHSGGENGHEHRDVPWSKLLSLLGWVNSIWRFPQIGVPANHPFYMILQDFPLTIQLLGYLHLWNPHMHPYAHSRGN